MYRYRQTAQVLYGHFADYLGALEELNEIAADRGWRTSSFWVPVAGASNEIVLEVEYDSLAQYEEETNQLQSDAEFMKVVRRASQFVVQGSARDEILTAAPTLA